MATSSFIAEVKTKLDRRFMDLGFQRKHGTLWKQLSPSALGFLGLGCTAYERGNLVSVFPVLGVRFAGLYELGVELGAYPESKTNVSLSAPLKYLKSGDTDYELRKDSDNSTVLSRLSTDVENYGRIFFDTYHDLTASLARLAQISPRYVSGVSEFVPLAHLHVGALAQAIDAAMRYAIEADSRRPSGRRYHAFLSNLRRVCGSTPTAPVTGRRDR